MRKYLTATLIILTLTISFWAILDLIKSRFKSPVMKTVWLSLILVFPVIGAIVYFQIKRKRTTIKARNFQPKFHEI